MSIAALSSFENLSLLLEPYSNDISVGLIFTVGYYLFKYFNKTPIENKKKTLGKEKESHTHWDKTITLNSFNTLILQNQDPKIDAYNILTKMHESKVHPDVTTYNRLIDMSFKFEQDENALKLFDEVCDSYSGVQPDIVTFNIMIKHYVKEIREFRKYQSTSNEKKLEKVFKIFSDIKSNEIPLNSITFNTLMDACVEVGDFEKTLSLFEEMKNIDIKPDIYTYAVIVKGLKGNKGMDNVKKAIEIFELVKKDSQEIKIDEVLFNSVLDICIKNKNIEKAQEIFNEMKNGEIIPSVITYSIMIKGYGNEKNLEKCYELYQELISNNLIPNEVIYGCLMNCAVKCSNFELMVEIYEKMNKLNIKMNSILYTTLIKGFAKMKKYENSFAIYDSITFEEKEKANIILFNAILDVCAESENYEKLISIFNEIEDEKNENFPNANLLTYSSVIKGMIKAQKFNEAYRTYTKLRQSNIKLDEIVYNVMIDGFAEAGEKEKAENLFIEMKKLNVKRSSIIYSILIKMYAKTSLKFEEDLFKATNLIKLMREDGIKPSVIAYTTIMQMYLRKKNIKAAINIFQDIKNEGLSPDAVSYNFIINGCTFNQNLEHGIAFLLESLNKKIKLNSETYKNTLEYLLKNKFMKYQERVASASDILKAMKENNIELNYDLYSRVMRLIFKNNEGTAQRRVEQVPHNNSNIRQNFSNFTNIFKNTN
jgi:pentatricopeptide repeat protein